jgi:HEAT repeat protein
MDPPLRSNGSASRPSVQAVPRVPGRSRVAARVDRVLNTALGGERAAVLNATAAELLAEPVPVARIFHEALRRPETGLMGHLMVQELLRRSNLYDDLVNSLGSPNPVVRAAAARVCAAARVADAAIWIGDLVQDPNPKVRDIAVRALAQLGGRRSVEILVAAADKIPQYRLAIALARGASDLDMEALMRQPETERTAVATVLACGLRRDGLRLSALLGIAHDRRWPNQVRKAACKALAAIGDRAATDALGRLAENDPDPAVKQAADRAHRRLVKRAVAA